MPYQVQRVRSSMGRSLPWPLLHPLATSCHWSNVRPEFPKPKNLKEGEVPLFSWQLPFSPLQLPILLPMLGSLKITLRGARPTRYNQPLFLILLLMILEFEFGHNSILQKPDFFEVRVIPRFCTLSTLGLFSGAQDPWPRGGKNSDKSIVWGEKKNQFILVTILSCWLF